MNKTLLTVLGLGIGALQAAPVTFQDMVNPVHQVALSSTGNNKTFSFEHNILDNGFSPSGYIIQDADLTLLLGDDSDLDYFLFWSVDPEFAGVSGDGSILSNSFEVNNGHYSFNVNSQLLQNDGKLLVTLTANQGDFIFKSSKLEVVANAAAVPEPASMALTAIGLAGLAFAARRKKA